MFEGQKVEREIEGKRFLKLLPLRRKERKGKEDNNINNK